MENQFKQIASLIGDPTRATIMWTLMDGKAFTATELALAADTSPQNISMHLSRLLQADLLRVENQGRHRYYKFARKEVAYAIEAMTNLIPLPAKQITEPVPAIKYCRSCYDHLAGKIGVAIANSLIKQKIILDHEDAFKVSSKGKKWFQAIGIPLDDLQQNRRAFIKPCLDWSERRHHIGGSVGAALLDKMLVNDWMRRIKNSRAIVITGSGQKKLQEYFTINT
jgi:DNA-binding transcriptional ArsR family regulator